MTWRLLKGLLAASLGLLLVLGATLAGLLGTQGGSRWLLAQVPGLEVEHFSGRLGGAWQAERVRWQQADTQLQLQRVDFAWSPSCLLRLTLCLDRVYLEQGALSLPPSEASDAPLRLPSLKLPLRLQLGDIRLGELRLDGQSQLTELQLIGNWNEQGIDLQRLT
ncbi:hypothetical protein, partial [Bowmanella yangjiangensis]